MKKNQDPSYYVQQHLQVLINDWSKHLLELENKGNLKELCLALNRFTQEYDEIDKLRKELGALYDKLNENILPKAFEDQGIDKIAIPELGKSFYPLPKYSASFINAPASLKWLREHDAESLITETVNRNTLAAYLKGRLLEEGLDPPECMKLDKYQITGSSKYTPKEK